MGNSTRFKTITTIFLIFLLALTLSQNMGTTFGNITATSTISLSGTITPDNLEYKQVFISTSWWLAVDPVYGVQGSASYNLMSVMNSVDAKAIMIFYRPSTAPSQFSQLVQAVSYLHKMNIPVWIELGVETIPPAPGSVGDTQYIVNAFGHNITGIIFAGESSLIGEPYFMPSDSQPWLVNQKILLAQNGFQCGFYQGDDFAEGYGAPTDVNATYLQQQGLIPWGWILTNSGSWKLGPFVPTLTNFWLTYDLLISTDWGGPQGQSYNEIYNLWYLNNIGLFKNLINNPACKVITWQMMNSYELPNQDALNGMIAVSQDWQSTPAN
jgi:hypothetical protein